MSESGEWSGARAGTKAVVDAGGGVRHAKDGTKMGAGTGDGSEMGAGTGDGSDMGAGAGLGDGAGTNGAKGNGRAGGLGGVG